jgi:hypothetical protein
MLKIFFCALALFMSSPAFAALMTITGGLPRNLNEGSFKVTIVITGVTPDEKQVGDTNDSADPLAQFKERIYFKVTSVDSSALPTTAEEAEAGTKKLYAEQEEEVAVDQAGDGTWTYTYVVRVVESANGGGIIKEKVDANNGKLQIAIEFFLGDAKIVPEQNFELQQESYVINAAPNLASIVGTNRAIRANWDVDTAVAIKGGTGEKAPSTVNVFVVDRSVTTSATLAGKKFEPSNAAGDPADACTYTDHGAAGGACVVCPTDVYLDIEAIKAAPPAGFRFDSEPNATGFTQVAGLDNAKQYLVFLQYEPDGLQTSQCLAGQPSPDLTLTEANGEDEAEIVDFRCFVATATYGTPLHDDLTVFRQFRDRVLMTSAPGRALVAVYYEHGPAAARFIAAHPRLRAVVRAGLQVVADALR